MKLIKNGKTLLETIYPDFDEKASTSQPNRLKRSIGTVDTSIAEVRTNEIAIRGNRCQNVFFQTSSFSSFKITSSTFEWLDSFMNQCYVFL